jgi:hypothetical protein
MNYHIEYSGGLGDIFNAIYWGEGYRTLGAMHPQDTAHISLITHNPFADELFKWHPKRTQMEVRRFEYWHPKDDIDHREMNGIQPPTLLSVVKKRDVEFYPSPAEASRLDVIVPVHIPYVVVSAVAGDAERTIPKDIVEDLCARVAGRCDVMLVGREYARNGRKEYRLADIPRCQGFDCVNVFSVPGVAQLLQDAAGLVTCHSALNLLGWHMNIPQLLLYPDSVFERHIKCPDQWAFGIGRPKTKHCTFARYGTAIVDEFLELI